MSKVYAMQMGEINVGSYKFWGNGTWTEDCTNYDASQYAYVAQDAVFGFGFWDVDQKTLVPSKLQAFNGTISKPVQAFYDTTADAYASNITFAIFNTGASGAASIETSIDLSMSKNNVFAVGMFKEGTTAYFKEYDKESAFANVVVKKDASVKVGLNGYIWVGSAQNSDYETKGEFQSQRFSLTVDGGTVMVDAEDGTLKVANTGVMTIKNGGYVSAPCVYNRNIITVDGAGSKLEGGVVTVYSEADAAAKATLNVLNGASLLANKLTLGKADNETRRGEMIIENASATINNTLIVEANGSVVMNGASSIQVGGITTAVADQNWLSITIDAASARKIVAAAAKTGDYAYLVNLTGDGDFNTNWVTINEEKYAYGMEVAPGYYLAISDNDLVITAEYIDVLYVKSDYSEGNAGGHIFGYNAFTTVDNALAKEYPVMTTIMLMDDSVESSTSTWFGGYIIKNGSGKESVTLTINYTIGAAGPGIEPDDVTAGTSMTIDEGVVVNSTADLYAYNGKAVVSGVANVNGICLIDEGSFYGSTAPAVLEVNKGGTVTAKTLTAYDRSVLSVTEKAILTVDGDAKFKAQNGGTNTVKFSEAAAIKFNGNLDYAAGTMTVSNTVMAVSKKFAIAADATVIIEGESNVEVAGNIANKGYIKVSGTSATERATLSATNVENEGDIEAANATIKFYSLTGKGNFIVEAASVTVDNIFNGNATVKDSTFTVGTAIGTVKLAGDIVIAGDFTAADIDIASKEVVNMSVVAGKTYKDDELFSKAEVAYGAGTFVITNANDADFDGGTITIDVAANTSMTINTLTLSGVNSFAAEEYNVVTVGDMILEDLVLSRYESVIGSGFAGIKNITFDSKDYTLGIRNADTGIQFTLECGVLKADKLLEVFDANDNGRKDVALDGADYYGSNLEDGAGVKAMNISNVTVADLKKDDASTRVFGGSKIIAGYYAAGLDITSVTVKNSGIAYQVYGGSNVQGGAYAGTVDTAVTIESTFDFGTVVGGSRVEGARMNVIGDSSVTINGGTYKLVVGASVIGKDGDASMMGNSDVTIKGGAEVDGYVYGGGFVQSTGKYQQIGSTNVTIEDSKVTKGSIYGGHAGASSSTFDATLVGSTYVTIVNSTIEGNVFGGSYNLGSITGSTNITISGNSDVLGFINGDSSNAIYYGVDSCVNGLRNLTFDGFTATAFKATEIVNIDNIAFVNNSEVNFANAAIFDGAEILDWTFEDGSSIAGAGVLDFEGSTLHITDVLDAADLEDWTLVAAKEIKNFDKLEGAFAVNGSNVAMTWNEDVDAYELSYYGTDYKLFQDGNTIKFTSTLA